MTVHYHGLPLTPQSKLLELTGCCFCVSFATPYQVETAWSLALKRLRARREVVYA